MTDGGSGGPDRPRATIVLIVGLVVVGLGFAAGVWIHDRSPSSGLGGAAASSTTAPAAGAGGAGDGSGVVRLGVPEEPASLDPFSPGSRTAAGEAILGQVLPQLFRVDPGGREQGWLADDASVHVAPDGRSATFSLRAGAHWSDGAPITADDLRFTADTVRGPVWPGDRAGYDHLAGVDGTGTAVTFRFDEAFPGWKRLFSGADFVLPAHRLAGKNLRSEWTAGPDLAGGPFRLGAVTPGLSVRLERNDGWWGGPVKAAAVDVTVVPDVRTMEQLLGRGELDAAWPPVTTNRIGRFRALAGTAVSVAEPGGTLESLVVNAAKVIAVDRRMAYLGLANRDRMADVLLAGEAGPAGSLAPAGPGAAGGTSPWSVAGLDPAGARLKGAPDVTFVSTDEDELSPLVGRVLQQGAAAAGADIELKSDEAKIVESTWLPGGQFELALTRTVEWPEPCWACWFSDAAAGRGNVSRVKDLTPLAEAADTDPAAVAALETRVKAEGLMLPLWRPRAVLAGKGVGNLVADSWAIGPFWMAERWTPTSPGVARK